MKTHYTRLFTVSILFLLFTTTQLWSNQLIKGSLSCDGINIPDMASVRINAFDADGDADELMGQTYLIDSKVYEIKYERKKWDPFPMAFTTWWRPDIYLTVEIYEDNEWITVYQSDTYEDWKTNYDLELHIYVEFNEPLLKKTKFSCSEHGWPFHASYLNKQSDTRLGGNISGGMCFGALDKFYNRQPREFLTEQSLEDYLSKRHDDAEKKGLLKRQYQEWSGLPDRGAWTKRQSIAYETKRELAHVRTKIDQGKPVILVLIPVSDNGRSIDAMRQVVAYRYEFDQTRQKTRIWIYDPQLVEQEEAIITVIHGSPDGTIQLHYDRESHWRFRGFFINPYDKKEKRKAFASIVGDQQQSVDLGL